MVHVSYIRNLVEEFNIWFPWALLTPVLMRIGRKYSLTRMKWYRFISIHCLLAACFAGVHIAMEAGLFQATEKIGVTVPMSFSLLFSKGFHYSVITYGTILAVTYILDFYWKLRDREIVATQLEAKLAQANLQMLKMQIHPHFLYNTLYAISALVYEDPEAADRMIVRLSELLRLTLDHKRDQEVSVREEMEFLNLYLEIMKTRFDKRLKISLEVEPGALEAQVPAFLLQPLVENAVRHGILPRKSGGRVAVRIRRAKGTVILEIEDDGPGFAMDHAALVKKGFGLANTEERLRCLYGEDQSLILKNSQEGGALVRIEISFHEDRGQRLADDKEQKG
jgi:sensor histidine kinase YesM